MRDAYWDFDTNNMNEWGKRLAVRDESLFNDLVLKYISHHKDMPFEKSYNLYPFEDVFNTFEIYTKIDKDYSHVNNPITQNVDGVACHLGQIFRNAWIIPGRYFENEEYIKKQIYSRVYEMIFAITRQMVFGKESISRTGFQTFAKCNKLSVIRPPTIKLNPAWYSGDGQGCGVSGYAMLAEYWGA